MRLRVLLFLVGVAGAALWLWQSVGPEQHSLRIVPDTPFAHTYLIQDPSAPHLQITLAYPYGEVGNTDAEGLAHYAEHLAWLSAFDEGRIAAARHANAWTTRFATGYHFNADASRLRPAIESLLKTAGPLQLDDGFALEERDIVMREFDLRQDRDPYRAVWRDAERSVLGDAGYAASVIGTRASIQSFTPEDAAQHIRETHQAAAATLIVYGDLSERRLMAALSDLQLPEPAVPLRAAPEPRVPVGVLLDRADMAEAKAPNAALIILRAAPMPPCPSVADCDARLEAALHVLDSALPGGLAGPLRFDAFVARSFSIDLTRLGKGDMMLRFFAVPDTDVPLRAIETVFDTALAAVAKDLPIGSFNRVKSRLEGGMDAVLEPAKETRDLVSGQVMRGEAPYDFETYSRALENVTSEDVAGVLRALTGPSRTAVRYVSPQQMPLQATD